MGSSLFSLFFLEDVPTITSKNLTDFKLNGLSNNWRSEAETKLSTTGRFYIRKVIFVEKEILHSNWHGSNQDVMVYRICFWNKGCLGDPQTMYSPKLSPLHWSTTVSTASIFSTIKLYQSLSTFIFFQTTRWPHENDSS